MNRRGFLKSLALIGAALPIGAESIALASTTEINQTWTILRKTPVVFYVNSWGTLSASQEEAYYRSRGEMYDIDAIPDDEDALIELVSEHPALQNQVEYLRESAERMGETTVDDWATWLQDDNATLATRHLRMWLNRWPDESDWEQFNRAGNTGQGEARCFFEREQHLASTFGIVIVDGDHPGSSYYAAELRTDVDEANAIARADGIPIRFVEDGE
jgi:hypothetical protein